jgi:hypothetical protein
MELGEFDMQEMLKRIENKWQKPEYNKIGTMLADIYEMIDDMATVLADFNRCESHTFMFDCSYSFANKRNISK